MSKDNGLPYTTLEIYKLRLRWARDSSVGIICLYYYLSLFRQSSELLGINVKKIASYLLLLFLIVTFVHLMINLGSIYTSYRNSRFSFIVILFCVLFFTYITQQSWLMIPYLLFLSFAESSPRELAKTLFVYSSIFYLAVLAIGVYIPDVGRAVVDKSYSVASVVGTNANSLGFSNSNHPLLYLTVIAINGAFLIRSRGKQKKYALIMFMLATVIFFATLSITGYICISIFLLFYYFSTKQLLRIARIVIPIIVLISIIVTPLLSTKYGHDYRNPTNIALSNRPYLWNLRVSDGAYHNLLGNADNYQSKDDQDNTGYTLDNQYLLLIARYGWLSTVIFIFIYFVGLRRVNNPAIIGGLLALSIYFIFESIMYILVLCIIPVVMIGAKTRRYNTNGNEE